MREFLLSVGYDRWILPALLIIPLLGSIALMAGVRQPEGGEDEVSSGTARRAGMLATCFFAVEFVLSLGLWWAFDASIGTWQMRF